MVKLEAMLRLSEQGGYGGWGGMGTKCIMVGGRPGGNFGNRAIGGNGKKVGNLRVVDVIEDIIGGYFLVLLVFLVYFNLESQGYRNGCLSRKKRVFALDQMVQLKA